jgi:hypothetical protein
MGCGHSQLLRRLWKLASFLGDSTITKLKTFPAQTSVLIEFSGHITAGKNILYPIPARPVNRPGKLTPKLPHGHGRPFFVYRSFPVSATEEFNFMNYVTNFTFSNK